MSVVAAILLASTSLHVTVWPNGQGHAPRRSYTLTCAPVGGTLPHRLGACRQLARLKVPFAPTPQNVACTEIYGGPAVARVRGTLDGKPVDVRLTRANGCEIARWQRNAALLRGG
jgi:hypothetical protein